MLVLWLVQQATRNAAWVDVGWGFLIGCLGLWYAATGEAPLLRRVIFGSMVGLWSTRLTWHLLRDRVIGQPEEGRYLRMRQWLGTKAAPGFLLFFLLQAALALLLVLPFRLAAGDMSPAPALTDLLAAVLFLVAVGFEFLADRQLAAFKRDPSNKGKVCRDGLWRYSRHPNYFFEWLNWCAFALLALPAQQGWWALTVPALMLFLMLKVTGIPPTEKQALSSRGDAYREYQKTTSAFFPLPPKPGNDTPRPPAPQEGAAS
jgi:steroid 5-alpha reductase family enzyme